MGRKPVLGLVGACLASVALVGCDNNLLQSGAKKDKDVAAAGTNGNNGWNQQRQGQTGTGTGGSVNPAGSQGVTAPGTGGSSGIGTTGGATWGNGSATGGAAVATGGSGSFNLNPRGPVDSYPEGRTMPSATGGVERVGYSGTPGAGPSGGRSAVPAATSTNPGGDPTTGGLPGLPKPLPTGGVAGGVPFGTLPPLVPPGAARPRVDDLSVPPTSRGPVVVPPPAGGATSGVPDMSGAAGAMPPPAPPPASSFDAAPPAELPPIPPPAPVSPITQGLRQPPLPAVSMPRGVGIPASPVGNQAAFQSGGPSQ